MFSRTSLPGFKCTLGKPSWSYECSPGNQQLSQQDDCTTSSASLHMLPQSLQTHIMWLCHLLSMCRYWCVCMCVCECYTNPPMAMAPALEFFCYFLAKLLPAIMFALPFTVMGIAPLSLNAEITSTRNNESCVALLKQNRDWDNVNTYIHMHLPVHIHTQTHPHSISPSPNIWSHAESHTNITTQYLTSKYLTPRIGIH